MLEGFNKICHLLYNQNRLSTSDNWRSLPSKRDCCL